MATTTIAVPHPAPLSPSAATTADSIAECSHPETPGIQVIRRDGSFCPFDARRISNAMMKAFVAVEGTGAAASPRIRELVAALTRQIVAALRPRADASRAIHIEDIQDQVELALMRSGEHKVTRAYVLYREERKQERERHCETLAESQP